MQVSALTSFTTSRLDSMDGTGAPTTPAKKTTLGQNDFLKLLAKQFQTQDPMKPMEDTSFIAQMAQFTALEQTSTMSKDIALLRSNQDFVTANSFLGRSVTVDLGDGKTETGNVSAIDTAGGAPGLVIGGKNYSLASVLRVQPGVVPPPVPQPITTAPTGV